MNTSNSSSAGSRRERERERQRKSERPSLKQIPSAPLAPSLSPPLAQYLARSFEKCQACTRLLSAMLCFLNILNRYLTAACAAEKNGGARVPANASISPAACAWHFKDTNKAGVRHKPIITLIYEDVRFQPTVTKI